MGEFPWRSSSVLVTYCIALAGCGQSPDQSGLSPAPRGKVGVVCTITMITDMTQRIAGDDADVTGLMKVGEDPHVYEVRPRDAQQIATADLLVLNGLHLESTLLHVVEHNARGRVIKLAEDPRIKPLGWKPQGDGATAASDPHCWFNVPYFRVYAEQVRDALCEVDPAHAEGYQQRADKYLAELDELHAWVKQQVDRVPETQRVIVTSHDAFAYYGQAYDIEVHAVIGITTDQQPKPQDVVQLEKLVRGRGVKALFIETSVSKTLNDIVERVADNAGARIGGALYSDSFGAPGTEAGSYVDMVRHNTRTIVEALR